MRVRRTAAQIVSSCIQLVRAQVCCHICTHLHRYSLFQYRDKTRVSRVIFILHLGIPSHHLGCHSPCLTVLFAVRVSPEEYRKSWVLWIVTSGNLFTIPCLPGLPWIQFTRQFSELLAQFFPRGGRRGILGRHSSLFGVLASREEYGTMCVT